MERLKLRYRDTTRAINTFREIVDKPYSIIVRDAAIQRFEYTFEALWKLIKEYLKDQDGVICYSPKSCFRDAFSAGILEEEEAVNFLEMTDDRNMTSHTYKEEVAQIIYSKLNDYCTLMENIMERLEITTEK